MFAVRGVEADEMAAPETQAGPPNVTGPGPVTLDPRETSSSMTTTRELLTLEFERHRPFWSVAYRMLSSVSEAGDALKRPARLDRRRRPRWPTCARGSRPSSVASA